MQIQMEMSSEDVLGGSVCLQVQDFSVCGHNF